MERPYRQRDFGDAACSLTHCARASMFLYGSRALVVLHHKSTSWETLQQFSLSKAKLSLQPVSLGRCLSYLVLADPWATDPLGIT